MTKLWLMHCACLEHPALFFKGMELVSDERRKKVNHAKKELSKRQMLGAGILLSYALANRGLKEQDMGYRVAPSGKPYFEMVLDEYRRADGQKRQYCTNQEPITETAH